MESTFKTKITVTATIQAIVDDAWTYWTTPEHIVKWNNASDEWFTPNASNDLRQGGRFTFRMEAKDGSFGFDFTGVYDTVVPKKLLTYTLADGRRVEVVFSSKGAATEVTEIFEAEDVNPIEMQRAGWQAILDNFKKYVEAFNV